MKRYTLKNSYKCTEKCSYPLLLFQDKYNRGIMLPGLFEKHTWLFLTSSSGHLISRLLTTQKTVCSDLKTQGNVLVFMRTPEIHSLSPQVN